MNLRDAEDRKSPAKKGTSTSSSKKRTASQKEGVSLSQSTVEVSDELVRLVRLDARSNQPEPYSIKKRFEEQAWIQHPKFGLGFVKKCVHPNKIEVLFNDDIRTLIHSSS